MIRNVKIFKYHMFSFRKFVAELKTQLGGQDLFC